MKKLFVVAMALFFVAGLVGSVVAEDRISLDGSYRARAWGKDNYSDFDDDNNADEQDYWDQRFRLGGAIQVAEGISAHFRIDIAEVQWGQQTTTNLGWNRPAASNADSDRHVQVDRAYARWERDFFIFNFGQSFVSFGNQIVVDQNTFGTVIRLKFPVVVDLAYAKIDESGSLEDSGNTKDLDFFGGQAWYKADNWDAGILLAGLSDGTDQNREPIVFGAYGSYGFGAFSIKAELDTFFGTAASVAGQDIDARGTQVYADLKWNAMPNLYVGVDGWYSDSQTGSGKRKTTGLTNSDSFDPTDWGTGFNTHIIPLSGLAGNIPNRNVPGTFGTPSTKVQFDPAGDGSGAWGFGIYGNFRFMEKFQVRGKYLYVAPSDSGKSNLDYVNIFNVGLIWDCLPNTTARVGYNYTGPSETGGAINPDGSRVDLDKAQAIIGMIQLTW